MKKYLATLHQRSPHHKRHFALLTASVITLFIFGVWSLVTFGTISGGIIAESESVFQASGSTNVEISPFQSLRMNLASLFGALKNNFEELKTGLEAVDLEVEYKEMRNGALDIYGQ